MCSQNLENYALPGLKAEAMPKKWVAKFSLKNKELPFGPGVYSLPKNIYFSVHESVVLIKRGQN